MRLRLAATVLEIALAWALLAGGLALRKQISAEWRFAGSDTYGYLALADELRTHHRYALGPPPEPLAWVRPPLYPIFLAAVKGDQLAPMAAPPTVESGWKTIQRAQIWIDVLAGLLVMLLARRIAGPAAGLLALALAMFCPYTAIATGSILTECLAGALTTATIAAVVLGERRPRRWFPIAGGLLALSTLLRPDGILLAVAFVPGLLRLRTEPRAPIEARLFPHRTRLLVGVLALSGFAVVFAPWPLRNHHRFGEFRPVGGRIDRWSRPVANYEGFWEWLRSWADDWRPMTWPTTCYYDLGCRPTADLYAGGYATPTERERVQELLNQRVREGHSPAVSKAFLAAAEQIRRRDPFHFHVSLPLDRAYNMWVAPYDELLQGTPPWPRIAEQARWLFEPGAMLLFQGLLAFSGLLLASRRTRSPSSVLVVTLLARSLVLSWAFYCMPRYNLQVIPLALVVVAAGVVEFLHLALVEPLRWLGPRLARLRAGIARRPARFYDQPPHG